ncbi:hypothetical protein E0Z10_g4905 [Xylaria hypoxylon]|uniref:Mediator of RNA polymerase II transcription subunit 9 n=1 Tax=Xylaria hypoxylon TaxID=37992 RepID=A0A4Z0YIY4_9PEZI|nr:hypothetical protein E0Z10_g4905 [Xylaria hypoxylon]
MSATQPTTKSLALPEALNPDRPRPSGSTGATPSQSQTQTAGSQATPTPTATALALKKNGELTLKEIPVAADALKHRFQRARTLIKTTLPDLDRGVADQEVEIKALEARIARQHDTLAQLREVGARLAVVQGEGEGDKMEE